MRIERDFPSALWRGVRAGFVAAAAATGTMLGFGLRGGIAARPFNAAAVLIMGTRARGVWGFVAGVSLAGEAVVIAGCVAAGALCAALLQLVPGASRARHPRSIAFAFAVLSGFVLLRILASRAPDFIGGSPASALSTTQGVVLFLAVSAAFASGMGLAR